MSVRVGGRGSTLEGFTKGVEPGEGAAGGDGVERGAGTEPQCE